MAGKFSFVEHNELEVKSVQEKKEQRMKSYETESSLQSLVIITIKLPFRVVL